MKVMHIHFGKEGGAERFFVNLVNALHDRGVEQRVLIRPGRSWRGELEGSAKIYEGVFRRISVSRFFLQWRMSRILSEFRPDVIMAWQLRASRFMPSYKKAFRIARLGDYPEHLGYYTNVETLVCITPDIAAKVREFGWRRDIEVIANFTRAMPVAPISRSELRTPADALVVVGMGRFVKRKGFDGLLRAVQKVEGVYLWLLGDGPERDELQRLTDTLGIGERVRFPGWQTNAYGYLAAGDVFAINSSHEPLGNVCFEGWGAGKPTIAARAEGPSWVMTHERDALMVDCGDDEGLANAIRRLRDDPELRERLSEGGRETLQTRFSEKAITDAYLELFARGAAQR
ncbi:glycosyltransferase [Sinorhizobium americanum]|uniref:Glycosyltransferase involved in cell wall biosynthesis n=1 Tax=Sinorhizobium americanum TaxID=194963 RepID=A0A4R2BU09_9HYPH|nr:glycosyltransferase [Sinorhizobium americanum]APG84590.1 lipopolysaccharide core biosynthesis glycosyltransferase LpsD [Sinorhizobium americanum CCGM7]TCN30435.1 glycosyltransferase involved in cell wall biosynthesis [Sinorhizobium americanum]